MCTGAEIAVITAAVVSTGSQIQGAHQERKAGKSKRREERKLAQEKIVADKEARATEQESIATGQVASIDANNVLRALGSNTKTGASQTLGQTNLGGKEVIGG